MRADRCTKVCYESEDAARRAMKLLKTEGRSRENKKVANRLNVYYHHECGSWHVGHHPTKGRAYRYELRRSIEEAKK